MIDGREVVDRVSVWSALGELKLKELMWPEGLVALVVGGGGSAYIVTATTADERLTVMGPIVTLSGAFVAVTFTALAIVVSLPSSSYLRMLRGDSQGGMWVFLSPFLVALGLQIVVVLLGLAYLLLAPNVRERFENIGFVAIGTLFVFVLLDLAALGRQLVKHGIMRAEDAVIEHEEEAAKVHRLPEARP